MTKLNLHLNGKLYAEDLQPLMNSGISIILKKSIKNVA